MECRGIGIINIAEMFGIKSIRVDKRVDSSFPSTNGRPTPSKSAPASRKISTNLGLRMPHVILYVRPVAIWPASSK